VVVQVTDDVQGVAGQGVLGKATGEVEVGVGDGGAGVADAAGLCHVCELLDETTAGLGLDALALLRGGGGGGR